MGRSSIARGAKPLDLRDGFAVRSPDGAEQDVTPAPLGLCRRGRLRTKPGAYAPWLLTVGPLALNDRLSELLPPALRGR
jgi:hypothetical protein